MKESDVQKLKCKHSWVTESDGMDSVTYCEKCMATKKELKQIKDLAKIKPLTEFFKNRRKT